MVRVSVVTSKSQGWKYPAAELVVILGAGIVETVMTLGYGLGDR